MDHPMFPRKLLAAGVRGEFKRAGSNDADVLESVRSDLVAPSKAAKMYATGMIVMGFVIMIFIITIPVGIIMISFGLIAMARAKSNARVIDDVFADAVAGRLT